jgi:superfamily II DNA or RNA helicase
MPVDWQFAEDIIRLGGVEAHKIAPDDGARQQETARSVLNDLSEQPGVILADEVGMGKTYVALGVVASVVRATRGSGRPVVVMVPSGLARKWPREWEQFKALCCTSPDALDWVRDVYVHTPTDFFKALGVPRGQRPHIVWMTTGCFGRGLSDPWTKLALVRLARSRTKMDDEAKKKIFKWATTLVRLKGKRGLTPEIVERLLIADLGRWSRILVSEGILAEGDNDPVPQHLLQHQREVDLTPLVAVLRGESIPGRRGAVSKRRLQEARWDVNEACQQVYWDWLSRVRWRASLLVLDEAHHAKNDYTRLASLFRSDEAQRLVSGDQPLLSEKFDRMLFLTATPFQLGHHELIRVLRSFVAAKWTGPAAPLGTREEFLGALDELEKRMNENRLAGRRLDRLWGRLAEQAVTVDAKDGNFPDAATAWWARVRNGSDDPVDRELLAAVEECRRTKARAESDATRPWSSLRPWVIRHNRPVDLVSASGGIIPRRQHRPGRDILKQRDGDGEPLASSGTPEGLPIAGEDTLPFLLAARAQGELAQGSAKGRAFFAEGLCSSFEAFHHTRENRGDARDVDDEGVERSNELAGSQRDAALIPVAWYEEQIQHVIPSKTAPEKDRYAHPKMRSVVDRIVDLWLAGEKVLVFCFYRETAKALREHVGREVENATLRLVADKLGLDANRDVNRLHTWFERVTRRLADEDSPFHQSVVETLRESLGSEEFTILRSRAEELVLLLSAYVRSPSFIARYLPLDVAEVREALSEGSTRTQVVRAGAAALSRALIERTDASAMSMRQRVEEFLRFAKELAELEAKRGTGNIEGEDGDGPDPLAEYLDAIAVYVSPKRTGEDDDKDASAAAKEGAYRVLPTVRMVYGDTKREIRERLMLAFNSPLFPEILISSAVLAEGVDLHRFCRYVIHHDLCWNPSTLEQRTGRLDRIRCKAELAHRPIVIYEPFIGGSADEKMYRVVRDRERWFQIVMGQKFEFDEASSEALSNRVLLPEDLAAELVFDLRRWRKEETMEAVV